MLLYYILKNPFKKNPSINNMAFFCNNVEEENTEEKQLGICQYQFCNKYETQLTADSDFIE